MIGGDIAIVRADPGEPDARALIAELSNALAAITGASGAASFDEADVRAEDGRFLLARSAAGEALGCGALRRLDSRTAELKRMYIRAPARGLGGTLLAALEEEARALGYRRLLLETRRVNVRATSFYRRHGYCETENFGRYVGRPDCVCFEKTL